MKKKIHDLLAVVLTLCIALNLFSVPALAAGSGTKDAPWDISETAGTDSVTAWYENNGQNGCTLHIEGSGRMAASFRDAAAPWAGIKQNITEVVVEEGITNIGAYAFNYCRRLSRAALPESLTEIGTYAFHATGIKRLTIPAGVDTIGRMIATPNTYYVVLGNPRNVNDHAFSTSLVSAVDKASAVSLNSKTNVSAIIVLDGGIYGETDEDLANLSYGLIDPVKEGYTFKGWYRDDGFTLTCKVSEDGRTIININNIYYAKWTEGDTEPPAPAEYTVTFDSQGGSTVASQTVVGGGTAAKPADPARTGYTFGGWFTDAACTVEWDFGTAVTKDITLYAKWTETQPGYPDYPTYPTYPTYPGNPGSSGTPEKPDTSVPPGPAGTTTTVTENEDGSTTTTVTDNVTGESVATTARPDGTREVVETSADGTVTATITTPEGGRIVKEMDSSGDAVITVTNPSGETVVNMDVPASIPTVDNGFTDVPSGHYAEEAINQAVAMGLTNGVGDNTFGTDTSINRAMVATILYRLAGMEGEKYVNHFTDVQLGHYAENAIAWADLAGVVNGRGDGTFAPEDEIKREDMAVMLYRFVKLVAPDTKSNTAVLASFSDSDSISGYAREAMAWCVSQGIIKGTGGGIIDPGTSLKRCDAMLMIQRFLQLVK